MSSGSFKNCYLQNIQLHILYLMYKQDFALNKHQGLMCYKTQLMRKVHMPTNQPRHRYDYGHVLLKECQMCAPKF